MIKRRSFSGEIHVTFACGCEGVVNCTCVDDTITGTDIDVALSSLTPCDEHDGMYQPPLDVEKLLDDILDSTGMTHEELFNHYDNYNVDETLDHYIRR